MSSNPSAGDRIPDLDKLKGMDKVTDDEERASEPDDEKPRMFHTEYPEYGELKTEVGLKFINWGLLFFLISTLLTLAVGMGESAPSTTAAFEPA